MRLIGYENILNNLKTSRVYLIHGALGTGKTELAKEIIKKDLCENKNACGECLECQKFEHGNYIDFRHIKHLDEKGKKTTVGYVREELLELYKKSIGEKHYVLIDDLDKMHHTIREILLKPLEDYNNTFIVITCTELNKISKTIQSRCTKVKTISLSEDTIREYLKEMIEDEKLLELVLKHCDNSIGKALKILKKKDLYLELENDFNNLYNNNFYELSTKYENKDNIFENSEKEDIYLILSYIEKYIRDKMVNENLQPQTILELSNIIFEIKNIRNQLVQNIKLNYHLQPIFSKLIEISKK